jgi:hypothetical protein
VSSMDHAQDHKLALLVRERSSLLDRLEAKKRGLRLMQVENQAGVSFLVLQLAS